MSSRRALVRGAWFQWRVGRQISTGCGGLYLDGTEPRAPGWFYYGELGFGLCEGPSLEETERNLRVTNRERQIMFNRREGVGLRRTPEQIMRRMRRVMAKAGARMVRGRYVRQA